MMADSVEGDGSNGGGSGNQERLAVYNEVQAAYAHARAYDHAVMYAHLWAYVSLAVKASGILALLLSTVILLGGYVQSLGKKDFLCVMSITVIQAAGSVISSIYLCPFSLFLYVFSSHTRFTTVHIIYYNSYNGFHVFYIYHSKMHAVLVLFYNSKGSSGLEEKQ